MKSMKGIGKGNKGWKGESMRHSLASKGIKTGRKKPYYDTIKREAQFHGLVNQEGDLTSKGKKYTKIIKTHDIDGDGVPDIRDCEPLNPKKQDKKKNRKIISITKGQTEDVWKDIQNMNKKGMYYEDILKKRPEAVILIPTAKDSLGKKIKVKILNMTLARQREEEAFKKLGM